MTYLPLNLQTPALKISEASNGISDADNTGLEAQRTSAIFRLLLYMVSMNSRDMKPFHIPAVYYNAEKRFFQPGKRLSGRKGEIVPESA